MAKSFTFRRPRWTLLSWQHRTLLIAALAIATGLVLSGAVVTLWQFEKAQFRSWFSLTFAPFVFVVMLGVVARIQQRIDLRAGRHATLPTDQTGEGDVR